MKKNILLSALLIPLFLGGCQLTHVEGEFDGVNIRATTNDRDSSQGHGHGHGHGHSQGSFCPPGQAKKGNC